MSRQRCYGRRRLTVASTRCMQQQQQQEVPNEQSPQQYEQQVIADAGMNVVRDQPPLSYDDHYEDDEEYRHAQKILRDFHRVQSLSAIPEESTELGSEDDDADILDNSCNVRHRPRLIKNSVSFSCLADLAGADGEVSNASLHDYRSTSSRSIMIDSGDFENVEESHEDNDPWDFSFGWNLQNNISDKNLYENASEKAQSRKLLHGYDAVFVPTRSCGSMRNNYKKKVKIHITPRSSVFVTKQSPPSNLYGSSSAATFLNNKCSMQLQHHRRLAVQCIPTTLSIAPASFRDFAT